VIDRRQALDPLNLTLNAGCANRRLVYRVFPQDLAPRAKPARNMCTINGLFPISAFSYDSLALYISYIGNIEL